MLRAVLLVLLMVAVPVGVAVVEKWPEVRPYPKRFATIEEGGLYRGAYPSQRNVRILHDEKKIKTIVALTGPVNDAEERGVLATAKELGVEVRRFPMPGDGLAEFDILDDAADALNQKENWPVFFHCQAGEQRTNATLAAWRMRHCGYSLEQALAEITKYGLERDHPKEKLLVEHLTRYARHLGIADKSADTTAGESGGIDRPRRGEGDRTTGQSSPAASTTISLEEPGRAEAPSAGESSSSGN